MTPPTDQLAGLFITSRMSQRTRAEAQRERRRREREEKRSLESLQGASPDARGLVEGTTRLLYQVGALRSPTQAAVIRGLTADNISAEAAKAHELAGDEGHYVAIQIVERLRMCIYSRPRDGRIIDCGCAEFRSRTNMSVCPHVYWLYDRMNAIENQSLTPNSWPVGLSDVENVLEKITRRSSIEIDCLAEQISPNWTESDEEADREVEDMLTVLDPKRDRMAGDYDEQFYSDLPKSSSHRFPDLIVPGNLFSTIFALARHDPIFRERLSVAVTRDKAEKDFFRKLNKRRTSCFAVLDTYIKQGTKLNANIIGQTSMKLRDIISKMEDYRERIYETPNLQFDRSCARVTIKILQEICNWNRDLYSDVIWLKEPSPVSPQDRNLFVCIISGWNPSSNINNHFIFNFLLEELMPSACVGHIRDMTDILAKLREFKAPPIFITKLERFVQSLRSEPQVPLGELDNYQSPTPSTTRSARTDSQSSNGSCISNNSNASGSRRVARRPSTLEMPEAQRRRLQ